MRHKSPCTAVQALGKAQFINRGTGVPPVIATTLHNIRRARRPSPGKGATTAAQDANTYNFVSLGLPPIIPVHQSGDGRPARHCYHTAQHQTGETPVPRQKCRAQKDVPDLQLEQTWQGSTAVTLHVVFRRSRMESIDGFYQQEPDSA